MKYKIHPKIILIISIDRSAPRLNRNYIMTRCWMFCPLFEARTAMLDRWSSSTSHHLLSILWLYTLAGLSGERQGTPWTSRHLVAGLNHSPLKSVQRIQKACPQMHVWTVAGTWTELLSCPKPSDKGFTWSAIIMIHTNVRSQGFSEECHPKVSYWLVDESKRK